MQSAEDRIIKILSECGIDYVLSLPCDRIKSLVSKLDRYFLHIPLTREEEGVGISAGLALARSRPAMFIQSSGIGNMINALLSLTGFYELPLSIFISHRGVYKEKIAAQVPMGQRLTGILQGAGISYSIVDSSRRIDQIKKKLASLYEKDSIHAFLLSPRLFEITCVTGTGTSSMCSTLIKVDGRRSTAVPRYKRYEILKHISPLLHSKVVVCNLGIPSKELYDVGHQPSNFYMLGSMGMATPIGLGISLSCKKEVVIIDGDGSLLMNPGTLATAAYFNPDNLTILAIDNASYGSTGGQPTLTGSCVDLFAVAKGFGIRNVFKTSGKKGIIDAMLMKSEGMKFIHVPALPGNADVPNIPLNHMKNKRQVMEFISS